MDDVRSADAEALRDAISTILHVFKVENAIRPDSAYARLNASDIAVLLLVRDRPASSMTAIARHIGSRLSSAGTIIERLVQAGLAARTRPSHDRRAVLVELTARGARVADEIVATQTRNCADMLAALSPDDRPRLLELMAALAAGVRS